MSLIDERSQRRVSKELFLTSTDQWAGDEREKTEIKRKYLYTECAENPIKSRLIKLI